MGLFDNIRVDRKLPIDNPALEGLVWQTQSFDIPQCEHYSVDPSGFLWLYTRGYDHIDSVSVDFTGGIRFYGNGPDGVWLEFVAFVEHGKVFKIVQVEESTA